MLTRAQFLAGILASPAISGQASAASAAPLRISPTGTATGDGASWATAGNLASLPTFVATAATTGREIWLRADQGAYKIDANLNTIVLTSGGREGAPVVIRGATADGGKGVAVIDGTRVTTSHSSSRDPLVRGFDVFKIQADWLTFSDLQFNRQSRIFDILGDRVGINLINISAKYYRAFCTNVSSGNAFQGTLRKFSISGGKHDYMDYFTVHLAGASDGVVEDLVMDGHGMRSSTAVPFCLHLMATTDQPSHDIVVRRCTTANLLCSTTALGSYWNGDGFCDERNCNNIRYEDCEARNMTDGGFDLKSENVVLLRCKSYDNKKSYRLWGSGQLTDCESSAPVVKGHGPACHCDFASTLAASTTFTLTRFKALAPATSTATILNFTTAAPVKLTLVGANFSETPSGAQPAAAPVIVVGEGYATPIVTWQ